MNNFEEELLTYYLTSIKKKIVNPEGNAFTLLHGIKVIERKVSFIFVSKV